MTTLLPQAVTLGSGAIALAKRALAAFRSPDPSGLVEIARTEHAQLRFLGEAFGRLMQEYPGRSDGLSLTERRTLLAVAGGAPTIGAAFRSVMERERRPFLGDLQFFDAVQRLGGGAEALLQVAGPGRPPDGAAEVALSDEGRRVLAGEAEYAGAAADRWICGVHLGPGLPEWRYDERLESLVKRGREATSRKPDL